MKLSTEWSPRMARLAWHGFRFTLPSYWEVVGYSADPRQGQMDLATREGSQGQIHWRTVKQRPDEVRILTEVHRRTIAASDPARAEALGQLTVEREGRFVLVYGERGDPCQAATWLESSRRLIQLFWPNLDRGLLAAQWRPLLRSFRPNDDDEREWALFGLGLRLPSAYELEEVTAVPAQVGLTFVGPRHAILTHRRWGLPEERLRERSLGNFYGRVLKSFECRLLETRETRFLGCDAVEISFEQRGRIGLDKLSGRWWPGSGVLWFDRGERRLYSMEQTGPARAERLDPQAVLLR